MKQMGKILFFQWHSFMNPGIEAALKKLKPDYDVFYYQLTDWEGDTRFQELLRTRMKRTAYELVFSVNFTPLAAQVCREMDVPYAAWIYDSPIHIHELDTLYYETSYLFCFDRVQARQYKSRGIQAYHQPLAADPKIFLKEIPSASERKKYGAQISLVGNMYQTDYAYYCGPLTEYQRGYLEGILKAQQKVYGAYLIPESLTDEFIDGMNARYHLANPKSEPITRRQLEYMLACEVTGRERFLALGVLSNHFQVKHYAGKADERLTKVEYMGYANYDKVMPKVFQCSSINLNISLRTIQSGIPLRALDIMACGGFLVSNYQEELAEYCRAGEELVLYSDLEELVWLCDFYLKNEDQRKQIAARGQERVRQDFTYERALRRILHETLGGAEEGAGAG
jgi:spore maturation protein CgeB